MQFKVITSVLCLLGASQTLAAPSGIHALFKRSAQLDWSSIFRRSETDTMIKRMAELSVLTLDVNHYIEAIQKPSEDDSRAQFINDAYSRFVNLVTRLTSINNEDLNQATFASSEQNEICSRAAKFLAAQQAFITSIGSSKEAFAEKDLGSQVATLIDSYNPEQIRFDEALISRLTSCRGDLQDKEQRLKDAIANAQGNFN